MKYVGSWDKVIKKFPIMSKFHGREKPDCPFYFNGWAFWSLQRAFSIDLCTLESFFSMKQSFKLKKLLLFFFWAEKDCFWPVKKCQDVNIFLNMFFYVIESRKFLTISQTFLKEWTSWWNRWYPIIGKL